MKWNCRKENTEKKKNCQNDQKQGKHDKFSLPKGVKKI